MINPIFFDLFFLSKQTLMMQIYGNFEEEETKLEQDVKYSHRIANAFAYYGNRDIVLRKTIRFGGRIR